jgi:hypothetical protein
MLGARESYSDVVVRFARDSRRAQYEDSHKRTPQRTIAHHRAACTVTINKMNGVKTVRTFEDVTPPVPDESIR